MEKILVSVHVPYIEKEFDFLVPVNINTKDIVEMMQKVIYDSDEHYFIRDEVSLFDSMEGKLINQNNIVKFSGLKNGSHIMLM